MRFLHLYRLIYRLKSQLHFFHVLKDVKPQSRRALLPSADDKLIKAIVECALNTLNENHKLSIDEKIKLKKYKYRLRAHVNPSFNCKSKCKLLVQNGGLIFHSSQVFVGFNRITN